MSWDGITDATAVAEFADPDVIGAARDVEDFERLITDDRDVVSVSSDRGALWWNYRPTAERYKRTVD